MMLSETERVVWLAWIEYVHCDRRVLWTWERMLEKTVLEYPSDRYYFAISQN